MILKKSILFFFLLILAVCTFSAVSSADVNVSSQTDCCDILSRENDSFSDDKLSFEINDNITASDDNNSLSVKDSQKQVVNIKANTVTATYDSGKLFKIKVQDENNNAVEGVKLKINVYTGSKYKSYVSSTNSKGIILINTSGLKAGAHKVIVKSSSSTYSAKSITSTIKINPKAVKLLISVRKSKYYSIITVHVKDRSTKKNVNGIKLKLSIYTGKKVRTVRLKTGHYKKHNGIARYLTNLPSYGTHKVKIEAYGNYKASAVKKLTISKNARKYYKTYGYFSNGKSVSYVNYQGAWIKTRLI